jgi:hypothetical protein
MNYLVTIWDAGGSVPPELALARRLVAAGHQVVALAGPPLQPAVEAAGATFAAGNACRIGATHRSPSPSMTPI